MNKLVSIGAIISMFLSAVASAGVVSAPDWRGLDGTTYQEWRFDDADNPAAPEVIDNDYGSASASITVGFMGSGWWNDELGLGTQTGIWDIGGDDGSIVLDIDNRPLALDYKEIYLQVTYSQGLYASPTIDIAGAQFISSQTEFIEADGFGGGWYIDQSVWRITPNPSYEQIVLTGDSFSGSLIDQIVVDTYCVPEPTSIVLLMLGGFAVFRKRRQR